MSHSTNQHLILIEGAATYERILSDIREVEIDEGLRHIKDFLKIFPDFARAHNDLAVMYYQTGNTLKALAHYEKAHKLDPRNIVYRKNLADFYFVELEWTSDAIQTYLDILKDNPFDIESLNALGTISLHLGRREQARQYFSRTLQLDTNNYDARQALQQLPAPTDETAAVKPLQHMLSQMTPKDEPTSATPNESTFQNLFNIATPSPSALTPEELYSKAMVLVNANKSQEAVQVLETVVSQEAGYALAHNDLGVLYQMVGELQKARQQHEIAVRLEPANITFQKNLADLLCSSFGDFEEALTIYVKLFSENRHDVEILKALAHICLEVDKSLDAQFFLEQVLTVRPWDQEASDALRTIKASFSGTGEV
jgi:Flp pilus assembly protein TadD